PFWTSFLIRVYAWIVILRPGGILNSVLEGFGLIDAPLRILNTEGAVYLGMVFCYLPFMILPLYARLEKLDPVLLEAAADLGARPVVTFWRIVVPLAWPGIVAGCLLMFIPAVGEFVIPEMMGGADTLMIGRVMWSEFFTNRDWPVSAALSVVLLILLVAPISLLQTFGSRPEGAS
ncbi:MAG: ABC transporter permease subunit, partial [Rhodobacteraceae bacterium]|nr:ABC transporter permease subunit [Paracoccaceae bacterium]